jgi:hypothetical protein
MWLAVLGPQAWVPRRPVGCSHVEALPPHFVTPREHTCRLRSLSVDSQAPDVVRVYFRAIVGVSISTPRFALWEVRPTSQQISNRGRRMRRVGRLLGGLLCRVTLFRQHSRSVCPSAAVRFREPPRTRCQSCDVPQRQPASCHHLGGAAATAARLSLGPPFAVGSMACPGCDATLVVDPHPSSVMPESLEGSARIPQRGDHLTLVNESAHLFGPDSAAAGCTPTAIARDLTP